MGLNVYFRRENYAPQDWEVIRRAAREGLEKVKNSRQIIATVSAVANFAIAVVLAERQIFSREGATCGVECKSLLFTINAAAFVMCFPAYEVATRVHRHILSQG